LGRVKRLCDLPAGSIIFVDANVLAPYFVRTDTLTTLAKVWNLCKGGSINQKAQRIRRSLGERGLVKTMIRKM